VEWLFKALVRFVDFFPDTNRQKYLAAEYNRLQKKDLNAVKNFLTVYRWLEAGQKQGHLSKAIEHSLGLFVGSCQLSQDEVTDAYPAYWPSMLMAAGIQPERVPRRVAEIPLSYLKNWYVQRQQNIEYLLRHAQ
jgi:hypothetical protein